jgi:hypothetical protein
MQTHLKFPGASTKGEFQVRLQVYIRELLVKIRTNLVADITEGRTGNGLSKRETF